MTRGKIIGPIILSAVLVVAGLYLRTDSSAAGTVLGNGFLVIGALALVCNVGLYLFAGRGR